MELKLFFVLAFLAGTQAGPIQEVAIGEQCSTQCTVSNQFNYEPGTTYEYRYDNEIRTAIQGASEDHAGFHLSATVAMEFISKCEAVMRVTDVSLKEHDPETANMKDTTALLGKMLEQNPVRVSYQDGNIEEICLSAPEIPEVLNIKKGILSSFQISMSDMNKDETVTEDDVSGKCETNYTSSDKGWYHKTIKKSKNLLGCTDRHDYRSSIQGIPYKSNSKIQTLPLVRSTHDCEHEVMKATGRLVNAMCQEKHFLAPFSRKDSGAVTHNTQKLSYVKEYSDRSKPVPVKSRTTLVFDHAKGKTSEPTIKDLESKLMDICASTKQGVKTDTPSLFTSLVNIMKNMDSASMAAVYKKIKAKTICSANNDRIRKFFLDAIPLTSTPSGLSFMVEMLQDNEISSLQADMWLTTLSFIQEPTMDMLTTVKPLLSLKANTEKAMLAVSSLVHSVCRNNFECENSLSVRKIIAVLDAKIGNCKVSKANFNTILYALRAIGNAGFGTSAIPTLAKCIRITNNPTEIRLSAIEAFQRIPCTANKQPIMAVFSDKDEDSEIRIAAYKSIMACPSSDVLSKVKTALASEEVNQVGSYIWSHLTNLMETSDPHKQSIRSILEDERLQKEFNLDNRKFSRNYEKSLFIEKLNTGVTAEGDLIWSSKSFIPRSAMVNLTVDLFGNAVNLFEIGGRVEGLEFFLESYFGPNGYFSEKDVKMAASERALEPIKADKSSRITKRMTSMMDELRGSMYMKVFGNELRYMNFQDLDSLRFGGNINIIDMMMKLAKESSYQFTHSTMFLDSSFVIPTCSGFPLNLTVNGTATIDLQASGKFDVMKMTQTKPTLDIHGIIRPSSAVEVSSSMSVDAFVTKVGLKMVSTLHSRTSVQGKVSLTEEKALNVDFDLPEEQMDIFSMKSSFFTIHRKMEREQKMITENRKTKTSCTGSTLAKITGLELCGEISYPNASTVESAPYFPMTGPVNMGISLYKRDSLTGYKLQARSTHTENENILRMAFSTPGSKVDRSLAFDLNLNKAENTFESSFRSPWKQADFKGTMTNNRNLKEIHGKFNWDGSLRYEVKASLASEKSGPGMVYNPSITIISPKKSPVNFVGTIKYAPWKLFDSEMTLTGMTATPIRVEASLMNKLKLMKASASVQLDKKKAYSIDASVQKILYKKKVNYKPMISIRVPSAEVFLFGGNFIHTYGKNMEVQATLDKVVSQPVILKAKVVKKEYRRNRDLYNIKMDLRSRPMDIKLQTKLDNRNMKTIATDIDFTYVVRKIARDNIKFVSKVINLSSKSLTKAKVSLNLASKRNPDYNFKMLGNINHNKKHSEVDTDLFFGKDFKDTSKQISLSAALDRALKSWTQSSMQFKGQLRKGNDLKLVGKVEHAHTKTSLDNTMTFRMNGEGVSTSLKLKDASDTLKNMEGNFEVSIPGKTFTISQTIVEAKPNQFTSTMTAQIGKAMNTVVTKWEKPSPRSLILSSSMDVAGMDPIHLSTEYTLLPSLYKVYAAFSHGKFNYSTSTSAKFSDSHTAQISVDIETPTRRVNSNIESRKEGDRVSAQADFRWNADRDDSKRVILSGNLFAPAMNNIDGTISVQHPSLALSVNLKHSVGSKYSSKLEVQVDNSQFFLIDTSFGSYTKPKGKEIAGTIDMKTPFKTLKTVKIEMNQGIYDAKYETNLDLKWNPNNVLSSKFTVKRPLSSKQVNVELIAKTPFKVIRTVHVSLVNKLKDGMFTIAKLNWNRQSVQVDVTLANRGNAQKTDLQGQIDIKTSFRNMKEGTMKIIHTGERGQYKSEAKLMINKKQYGVESEINHQRNSWTVKNNGQLTAFIPNDKITATWDHQNTYNDITTTSEIKWGKQLATVKYNALQDFKSQSGRLSSALEVQLPFSNFKDIVFQISHEHKPGQFSSNMKLESEREAIAIVDAKYLRDNGEVQSSLTMTNPLYDGDISLKLTSVYTKYPMNGHLELTLTPFKTTTIDASLNKDLRGNTDFTFMFSNPTFDPLTITGTRRAKSSGIESSVSVEYAPNKIMTMETVHKLGRDKMLKIKFTSSFTKIYSSDLTLSVSSNSFRSSGSIEAEPYISRVSAEVSVNTFNGLNGNLMVSTTSSMSKASISSEVINGERKSSTIVEYQPGKIVKILGVYKFDRIEDLLMNIELTTPFDSLPYSAVKFEHQGDLREFQSNAEIQYKGNTMSANTQFSTRNGYEGSIILMSPLMDKIESGFSHTGSLGNFKTHVEFTKGTKYAADLSHTGTATNFASALKLSNGQRDLKTSAKFVYEPKLNTEILIETPFERWDQIRLTYSLDGTLTRFVQEAELFIPIYGSFKGDSIINLDDPFTVSLNLKTPLKDYNNMMVSLSHSGSFKNFESQANIRNGQTAFGTIVKFNTNPSYNLDVSLRTPFENYRQSRVSLNFEGEPRNFKSNFELQRNKETSEIDLSFNFKRKLDIDLTIRSPYMDLIKASIDHWGSRKKFNSKLRMRIGKDKIISDVRFQTIPSLNAFVSLKTPYRPFKNHQFSLKHAGNRNSFKCNVDYKCNNLNYNADLTFQNLNILRGELNLKGSTFKPMKAIVTHDGPAHNFKSSGEISLGKKIVSVGVSLKAVDGLKSSIQIQTPFRGYESVKASYAHSGPINNFKCLGEASLNKRHSQFNLAFDVSRDVSVSLELQTPFDGLNDISTTFTHKGSIENFNTALTYDNSGRQIEGLVAFSNMKKLTSLVTLRSNYQELPNIEASLDHDGSFKKFKTLAGITLGKQKSEADFSFDSTNGYNGKWMINMPSKAVAASFRHDMTDAEISSSADFVVDGTTMYELKSVIFVEPSLSASLTVKTPVNGYEMTELTLNHDGSKKNFRSQMSLVFSGEKGEVEVSFDSTQDLNIRLLAESSLFKKIEFTTSYTGSLRNFNSAVQCLYGRKNQFLTEAALSTDGPISGSFKMISPHLKNIEVSFNHQGGLGNFKSNAEIIYAGQKGQLAAALKQDREIDGSLTLKTPLTKDLEIQAKTDGPTDNLRSTLQVTYGGESKLDFKSEWDLQSSKRAEISVETPFVGLKRMMLKFYHFGDISDFETKAELSKEAYSISTNVKFSPTNGKLSFRAPDIQDFDVEYTFNGKLPEHEMETKMTYGSKDLLHMNSKLGFSRNTIEGSLTMKSQVTLPMETSFTVTGKSLDRFSVQAISLIAGETHEFDTSFSKLGDIKGKLGFKSPYLVPVSVNFALKDNNNDRFTFDCDLIVDSERHEIEVFFENAEATSSSFTLQSPLMVPLSGRFILQNSMPNRIAVSSLLTIDSESHQMDMSFEMNENMQGTFNLKSAAFVPISLSFNANGNWRGFKVNADATINSDRHYGDVTFSTDSGVEGSFSLTSPMIMPVSGNMAITGSPNNFQSNVKMMLASESYEGDISFTTDRLVKGSIRFMPFFSFGNIEASFEHEGSVTNFMNHVEVSFDSRKVVNTVVVFNIDTAKKGSASFTCYDRSGSLSFDHEGTFAAFKNQISLEYNSESMLETMVSYRNQPITLDFAIKIPVEGLETVTGQIKHTGDLLNFENHAEIDISGEKIEADMDCNFATKMEARFSAQSPYFSSISAGFDISNFDGLKSRADFAYGNEKYSIDGLFMSKGEINADVTILTPFQGYRKITAEMTHKGDFPEMTSIFNLKTGRRTLVSTSIVLSQANGVTARMSIQSIFTPSWQLTLQHNGEIRNFQSNAELQFNGQPFVAAVSFKNVPKPEGSMSLSTPYTDDISGTFNMDLATPSAEFTSSYGDKSISGHATLMYQRSGFGGKASFKTPFSGFQNVNVNFGYVKQYKGIQVNAELEMNPSQKYEFETNSKWSKGLIGSASVKTPFSNLRHSSANIKIDGDFPNIKSEINILHSRKEFSLKSELQHDRSTFAEMKIETPWSGYELMGLRFTNQGLITDMATSMKVMLPFNEVVDASFKNVMTDNSLETKATLETPFAENMMLFDLEFSGKPTNFKNALEMSMGKMYSVKSQTALKLDSLTFDFDTTLSSVIGGASDEQRATFRYVIGDNSEVSADVKIFGSVYNLDSTLQLTENVNGMLSIRTPLPVLQDFSIVFSHTGNQRRFISKVTIQLEPGQVIDSTVEYVKYGWRRLQTSVEVQTPFVGFENTRLSYTHSASIDSFECDGALSVMDNDFKGNLKASRLPLSVSLQFTTPVDDFEQVGAEMKLDFGSMYFNGDASMTYMKDKTISLISRIDLNSSPKVMSAHLRTPFSKFPSADISLSHNGDFNSFQSVASITAPYIQNVRAEIEGQIPSLASLTGQITISSQIKNFENLKLSIKNSGNRGKYNTRMEANWSPSQSVIFEGSLKDTKSSMSADIFVSTPFESFRRYKLKTETTVRGEKYSHMFSSNLNGQKQADLDFAIEFGSMKSFIMTMKAPISFDTTIQAEKKYNKYLGNAVLAFDRLTYKIDSSLDADSNSISAMYECPENKIQVESVFSKTNPKADIFINGNRYGYDFLLDKNDMKIKAFIPSRTVQISGSHNYRTTEGSLMWDADRDETKKVGFRSVMTSAKDSMKADVTLMMPTFGKNVQLDSEMVLNKGRVLFDGKTELSYSHDSRKRFTITSRLADISNEWSSKNYSFSLGISHPYTSVGVQVHSHLAESDSKYTGGVSLEYLTVGREIKTFSVNGELNKLRNTINFGVNTPMKRIALSGAANTESPFVVSLQNKYDNKRPLNTRFSVNPQKQSIAFQMNYDLENPDSEFHFDAKYVNSSAVSAEMYHVANRQRITDVLTTVRLNNSHLLHSRLHWRPSMMHDLQNLLNRKAAAYKRRLSTFVRLASNDINYEILQKYRLIAREVADEMEFEVFAEMYDTNQYHVKDISDYVVSKISEIQVGARGASDKLMNSMPDIGVIRLSEQMAKMIVDNYKTGKVYVSQSANSIYNSGVLKNLTHRMPSIDMQKKYNEYTDYLDSIKTIPQKYVNVRYVPAMEDAMTLINSRVDGEVMQQAKNAYKYWEVRENTKMIVDAIVDWIKEEIDAEISDLKATLLNLKKSTVTVYDPKNGEIQFELHLPVPIQSLQTLPVVDVTPFLTKFKSYRPSVPSLSLPSADVSSWIPPFDGHATIQGDRITTFDGLTYDLAKQCTFILARDFVDGNFSAILHKEGNKKSVIILARGMSIEVKANGTVLVNGVPSRSQEIDGMKIQTDRAGHVTVDGAGNFEVSYNKDYDLYSFNMNGWYYGKVGGLFGTYDNEPSNDLMTSYGKQISNSDRFASTWDIGTARCR